MMHAIGGLILCLGLWLMWGPMVMNQISPPAATNRFVANLSEVEQTYYRQVFDYTMTSVPAGQSYQWESYSGKGTISVQKNFTSTFGSTCRPFSETYTSNGSETALEGVACKREGKDGWCRLAKRDAPTCAMEPPSGVIEQATSASGTIANAAKDGWVKAKGFLR